jgi:alkaline phosphatase D
MKGAPPELFLLRRAAAYQAWYEHVPVRKALIPRGPDIQMYRRIMVGDLVALNVLDTRQFRSPQACGGGIKVGCAEALEPQRTMMGATQERWLDDGFKNARRRWNVLAHQVILMRNDREADPNIFMPSMDKWDNAVAARDDPVHGVKRRGQQPIALAGDIHNNWAGELKRIFSTGSPRPRHRVRRYVSLDRRRRLRHRDNFKRRVAKQPYVKFFNNQRGYVPRSDARSLASGLPGARQGRRAGRPHDDTQNLVVESGGQPGRGLGVI